MSTTNFRFLGTGSWLAFCLSMSLVSLSSGAELVRTDRAHRFGLQRAWFSQVTVDSRRSHIVDWRLSHDRLYALTSAGVVQALDTGTGATLWKKRIGKPAGSYSGLSANESFVAVISGSYLHLFDRDTGNLRVTHRLESAPLPGPVLSKKYVFAALNNGKVEAYSLEFPEEKPWYHQSIGRIYYEPTVTGEVVSWPTDAGHLYVSQANSPRVLFRVETGSEIVAPPTELEPYLYVTSFNGYLYCVHERSGYEAWRWSTGSPILTKPAAVANTVYVACEEPALHALHAKTGQLKWIAPGLKQFVTEGKKNVYALDRWGSLVIVEKETGGVLGRLWMGEEAEAMVNDHSDRLYLVSRSGLVQCFHESESSEPIYYRLQPDDEAEGSDDPDVNPFAGETEDDDFTTDDSPGDEGSPFNRPDDEGFGSGGFGTDDADDAEDDSGFGEDAFPSF